MVFHASRSRIARNRTTWIPGFGRFPRGGFMSRLNALVCAVALSIAGSLAAQNYSISHLAGTTGGDGYQDGFGSTDDSRCRHRSPSTATAMCMSARSTRCEGCRLRSNAMMFAGEVPLRRRRQRIRRRGSRQRHHRYRDRQRRQRLHRQAGVTSTACVVRKITNGVVANFAGLAGNWRDHRRTGERGPLYTPEAGDRQCA